MQSWTKKEWEWKIRSQPFLKWVLWECDKNRTLMLNYHQKQNKREQMEKHRGGICQLGKNKKILPVKQISVDDEKVS